MGRKVFARFALVLFWLIMTILGLIVIRRKKSGDMTGFGGGVPSDISQWSYVIISLALLSFFYLSMLTILYIWVPEFVTDFIYLELIMDANTSAVFSYVGGGLTLLGSVIFLTAFFNLGSSIRLLLPSDKEHTHLVTDGWYAHSRNPLYLGLHISMIGWIFIFPSILTIAALAIFLINQHLRILTEEKFLEKKFGDEYIAYKKQVRRYL